MALVCNSYLIRRVTNSGREGQRQRNTEISSQVVVAFLVLDTTEPTRVAYFDEEDKEFRGKIAPELQACSDEVAFLHGRIMASRQSEVHRPTWR